MLFRLRHRLRLTLLCVATAAPTLLAQDVTYSRDEQWRFFAPTSSGQTGLFETVTADTLAARSLSLGIYFNDYDLLAGPARDFAIPSNREYHDMSFDHYRLSASVGYGLTDRWEISAMVPWDRFVGNGGDRAGFINGWLYRGRFTDGGVGDVRLATKFGVSPAESAGRWGASLFTDLPTGDEKSGISNGTMNLGAGLHYTRGVGAISGSYKFVGDRAFEDSNVNSKMTLPNEFQLDAGLNLPTRLFGTTNWISEINAVFYNGGDRKPDAPLFLVSGLRHWFGSSGWALNASVRWNIMKFMDNNDECRLTELDDCGLSGLVGLTFAPPVLAMAPPPPAPYVPAPAPPPPPVPAPVPAPAPVPPPEKPVTRPRQPQLLRTDEIHFEPGSARLTNIAKATLDDVALRMKQEPTSTALVIGYTDDLESRGPNRDLDRRRAEPARDYLVSRHGIDPARITVEGRDAREPIAGNSTVEGRRRNRRVVIQLILP